MDITLIVKASNQQFDDQTIKCEPSWTIRRLKGHLTEVYPGKPSTDEQKLIYSGQLLGDSVVLKDILRHYDGQQAHTVHLVFTPKNNRHRDFNSGGTAASTSSNSTDSTTMPPKSNTESGATSTTELQASTSSRVESTRSPEAFGQPDGLRQRVTGGGQNGNTVPTTMPTYPIPPASADYIMGQQLVMQNWMQQAYMQYLNQYMNVYSISTENIIFSTTLNRSYERSNPVSFPGKPFSSMIFHSSAWSIQSYAALESMNW